VPDGFTVLWVRIPNNVFDSYFINPNNNSILANYEEKYGVGPNNLEEILPDGGLSEKNNYHKWIPMPLRETGDYLL
jgi:hypothetical protein